MERSKDDRARAAGDSLEAREQAGSDGGVGGDARLAMALRRRVIQRKAERQAGRGGGAGVAIPESGGAPLATGVRAQMEGRLGADLGAVRVHTGGESARAASQLGARAFTVGNDVHFSAGRFAPDTQEGTKLLAHELTHVVQNDGGVHHKDEDDVSQPDDPAEMEADAVADRVAAGGSAKVSARGGARVHRSTEPGGEPGGKAEGQAPGAAAEDKGGAQPPADGAQKREKSAAPPASLADLAERLSPGAVGEWSANHDVLLEILKGPFESNWFKAKECLLMNKWPGGIASPDHAAAMSLMDGLVKMRETVCAKVQKKAEEQIQVEVQKAAKEPGLDSPLGDPAVGAQIGKEAEEKDAKKQVDFKAPVGNQKRTSDIDVATGGMNTELAVALFNRLFREMLGVSFDSGTVFDFNVYAMDWIHNLDFKKQKVGGGEKQSAEATTEIVPGAEHPLPGEQDQKERNATLEKAALLHTRRFMDDDEWKSYMDQRVAQAGSPEEKATLRMALFEVDAQYAQFCDEIQERSALVATEMDDAVAGLDSAWGAHNQHFQDEAVKTRASNAIYEQRLLEVKALRAQYTALAAIPEKQRKDADRQQMATVAKLVTQKLSEALYFANEVYASEGGTLHAVVGIQMANKKTAAQADTGVVATATLTPEQYLQSFHENVGDSLKDLGHFKDNPSFAVYRAGKYMDRMVKAADAIAPEAKTHELYAKLGGIAAKSVTVKDSAKGDDPLECVKEFQEYDAGSLAELRGDVIKFGADVPALAKQADAKEAEAKGDGPAPEKLGADGGAQQAQPPPPEVKRAEAAQKRIEELALQMEKDASEAGKGADKKPPELG